MMARAKQRIAGCVPLLLFVSAVTASPPGQLPYSAVIPGLEYVHIEKPNGPWSIHVARLDRSHHEFEILSTLGQGNVQGLGTLSEQVKALPPERGKPLVAINGDFFVINPGPYQGDPLGLQILDGELVSIPTGSAFWVQPSGQFHIESVTPKLFVTWPTGKRTPYELNQEPKPDDVVLFTPRLGTSTRTTGGRDLVLGRVDGSPWLPLRANQSYRARVIEMRSVGDTPLNPDLAVLSVGPGWTNRLAPIKPGDVLRLSTGLSKNLRHVQTAIGGRPVLISNKKIQTFKSQLRHPRTAIGWNRHHLFFVVVDGRQPELSIGMSFAELGGLMKELGCAEALNLDGGGSSTFWLGGKIRNSPSDQQERPVANALVIVRHEPKTKR